MSPVDSHILANQLRAWISGGHPLAVYDKGCILADSCKFMGRTGRADSGARALELLRLELRVGVDFDEPLWSANTGLVVIPFKRRASDQSDGILQLAFGADGREVTSINVYYAERTDALPTASWSEAQVEIPDDLPDGLELFEFRNVKRVAKNWGVEHWLYSDGVSPFGFKIIQLKAGRRTSLQYHETKDEGYFILHGIARLHYATDAASDVHTVTFPSGALALVRPGTIHRVEAVTDVLLVESSTKDDGTDNIRISDDWGRGNGRIDAEHR